jgi:hypothetical protein
MHQADILERNTQILIEGLSVLGVPLLSTEQYPKGLGPTLPSIAGLLDPTKPIEKLAFSCLDEPAFEEALGAAERSQVILCGIEAHVCVLQTAIDLKAAGFDVIVVQDCTSSRKELDADVAFRRMSTEGIALGTYESVLMEACGVAGSERFKAISKLIK